jgi:hypothetical protein
VIDENSTKVRYFMLFYVDYTVRLIDVEFQGIDYKRLYIGTFFVAVY